MAPPTDITPGDVRTMGDAARDIADEPLTRASKSMSDGYDNQSVAKLGGFQTKDVLNLVLADWEANTAVDVGSIRSVGDKLHGTANAIIHGDNRGVDEFKPIPVAFPHGHEDPR